METLARTIRAMQYSIRTEQAYLDWCHRFLAFYGDTPTGSVAAKTQGLAYKAVAFLPIPSPGTRQ